jgi:ubiquinone/menaquinone biosynthesis C-methylase UbiE
MSGRIYTATAGRAIAAAYDGLIMAPVQNRGFDDRRAALAGQASGKTIEIGAGTGLNLEHYTDAVTDLTLTEPGPHMARHLRERLESTGRANTQIVQTPGERLPFDDDTFDTALATLVLCTTPDPDAVLREIARVLTPGGRFLFIEHVRSSDSRIAKWQDRWIHVWPYLADGCHCNRDTRAAIERSPLELADADVDTGKLNGAPPILRPLIVGRATA